MFPLCQPVSAPDDEALKDSAYAPLCFFSSFLFFRSVVTSRCFGSGLPNNSLIDHLTITHTFPFFLFLFSSLSCRNQMGNLLKVLTCTELEQGPNFFLDFESELSLCLLFC